LTKKIRIAVREEWERRSGTTEVLSAGGPCEGVLGNSGEGVFGGNGGAEISDLIDGGAAITAQRMLKSRHG
jgi:hypothetical protein